MRAALITLGCLGVALLTGGVLWLLVVMIEA
jgi:hypothetical protein